MSYKYLTLHHDPVRGLYVSAPRRAAAFIDPYNAASFGATQSLVCGVRPNTAFAVVFPEVSGPQSVRAPAY